MAASDQEFKSAFSLLPTVLRLVKLLSTSSQDPQQQAQLVQSIVTELQTAVSRCNDMLEASPALNHTPSEQTRLLEKYRQELQLKCGLIHKYQELGTIEQLKLN